LNQLCRKTGAEARDATRLEDFAMKNAARASLVLLVLVIGTSAARAEDAVVQWNKIAVKTLTTQTPPLTPFHQARYAAIIQLAVFEAVNAITREYEPYRRSPVVPFPAVLADPPAGASPEAAAVAAAHAVLVEYFSGNAAFFDAQRAASLAAIPDGPLTAELDGIKVGEAAAAMMIKLREIDGSSDSTFYTPALPQNGVWAVTPSPACPTDPSGNPRGGILLNWRDVTPFGLVVTPGVHWSEPFRPGPPPALASNQYAKDYAEVKAKGALADDHRPADRAVVARFYAALSPTFLFHTAAQQLAQARGDSLSENARNLALISIATNDSLIASFATKYHYDFWRPFTAIRAGATDGNDKTVGDVNFATFLATPCFPSYPSNHASGSNGAAEMMRRIYGAAGHSITLKTTIAMIEVELRYTSLKQITNDVDDARIYGGMHFRFDQEAGARLGNDVATYVYKNNLQPVRGSN
jgi:hypothetical protein